MPAIPQNYASLRRAFDFDEVSLGYSGLKLARVEEIPRTQTEALLPDRWQDDHRSWLVIGSDTLIGDSIFLDTAETDLPVFAANHDEPDREPEIIAPSADAFFAILQRLRALAAHRETSVALEQHPLSEEETERFFAFVSEFVDGETPSFLEAIS